MTVGGAAGAGTKPPCHSHPGRPNAALMHAIARREGQPRPGGREMRDGGGGASLGGRSGSGAPKFEGPYRMLEGDWEGISDTSSTWRTFPAHSSCSSQGFCFPHVLGGWGWGRRLGSGGRLAL